MTMKDGIKLGIGFALGRILFNGTANLLASFVYPELYREMKKTNPKFAEYMNRVYPCEETITEDHQNQK